MTIIIIVIIMTNCNSITTIIARRKNANGWTGGKIFCYLFMINKRSCRNEKVRK